MADRVSTIGSVHDRPTYCYIHTRDEWMQVYQELLRTSQMGSGAIARAISEVIKDTIHSDAMDDLVQIVMPVDGYEASLIEGAMVRLGWMA